MFRKIFFSWLMVTALTLLWAGAAQAAPEIQISSVVTNVSSQTIQTLPVIARLIDIPGTNSPVDIHIGVMVPGGSIYELDGQLGFYPLPSNPGVSHSLIKNITIPAGTDTGWITLLDYQFTGNEPIGTYTVFGAVTQTGTYNMLSSDLKSGDYTPPSNTPLPPGISMSCVGVRHGSGVSYIKLCVSLTNVTVADISGFKAAMGSRQDSSITYNNDLTKVCAEFEINQYGSYSGTAGITTNGGTAAVSWDINVTSAEQPCQ